MDYNEWFILMNSFLEYKKVISVLNLKMQRTKNYLKEETKLIRNPNFPSELSLNLVKFVEKNLIVYNKRLFRNHLSWFTSKLRIFSFHLRKKLF